MNATAENQREFEFSKKDFDLLRKMVSERTGIVLADQKQSMVYSRIARRLRALRLASFKEYCELLQGPDGEAEMGDFINAVTTNLTKFFREAHHFDHLRDEVVAPMAKQRSGEKQLRIWSAAASSGMEPYSIAMCVREAILDLHNWDAKILATDIDTNMLATGKRGEYEIRDGEHIPAAYRERYCVQRDTPNGLKLCMKQELQELIRFNHLNLLGSWPMQGKFHAIFCRNVVIYFDKETQRVLFDRLANQLVDGGWLYIGHSENLNNVCDRFRLVGRTVYRKIR